MHTLDIWPTSMGGALAVVDGHDTADGSGGYSIGIFEVGPEKYNNNFDIWANEIKFGSDYQGTGVRTNSSGKFAFLSVPHITNSEEASLFMGVTQLGAASTLNIGGGNSGYNTMNIVKFFTAADNTTITGTNTLLHDGFLNIATGDEKALGLTYEVDKATSGNAYGLRITPTDTAVPAASWHYGISVDDITGNGLAVGMNIGSGWDHAMIIKDGSTGIRFGGAGLNDISFDLDPYDGSQPQNSCNNDGDVGSMYVDMDTGENTSALCACLKTGDGTYDWIAAAAGGGGTCD